MMSRLGEPSAFILFLKGCLFTAAFLRTEKSKNNNQKMAHHLITQATSVDIKKLYKNENILGWKT